MGCCRMIKNIVGADAGRTPTLLRLQIKCYHCPQGAPARLRPAVQDALLLAGPPTGVLPPDSFDILLSDMSPADLHGKVCGTVLA